jgi:hypothetical protein
MPKKIGQIMYTNQCNKSSPAPAWVLAPAASAEVKCPDVIKCLTPGSVPLTALAPGSLPATVTLPAANLTAIAGTPLAADEVLTANGKKLKIVQRQSSTGILLPFWDIVA